MRSRRLAALGAVLATAAIAVGCGSSGPPPGTGHKSSGSGSSTSAGSNTGSGSSSSTDTATFAEAVAATPNYIFPMLTGAYYTVTNIEQFQRLSFRSLYWIGNTKGQPVVDPTRSLAALPQYTNGNKTVTVTLHNYRWSDGAPVTTRDVAFWINLLKANKKQFAVYIPGDFPDNMKSFKILSAKKFQLTLTHPVNPNWFTYDQLSQITPLPQQAWDKTSGSSKDGNYDTSPAGAVKVFNYLTGQSKSISTYGSNPLWKVVDGPWEMIKYQSDGYVKFRYNPKYSGPTVGKLKYFVEEPFTTESAELNVLRAGNTIDYGYVPEQEVSQIPVLKGQGYTSSVWNNWGTTYFMMNFNNPTTGPIVGQTYIRQAIQSLVDEPAYVSGPYKGYAHLNYGPVPLQPSNPYSDGYEAKAPFPYSPGKARSLLSSHGWAVKANGTTTCAKAGNGSGECGPGVAAGAKLAFNLTYLAGNVEVSQEMQALKSALSLVGINLTLSQAPFDTIISKAAPCTPKQASCSWQMVYYGGGWTYGVDPYPTGEDIWATGSGSNLGNYSSKTTDALIDKTISTNTNLDAYENYLADQIPTVWLPQPAYQISEIKSNLQGTQPQSPITSLTPEEWSFSK